MPTVPPPTTCTPAQHRTDLDKLESLFIALHTIQWDLIDGAEPTHDEWKHLLSLAPAAFSSEGALPGFTHYFSGCLLSQEIAISLLSSES